MIDNMYTFAESLKGQPYTAAMKILLENKFERMGAHPNRKNGYNVVTWSSGTNENRCRLDIEHDWVPGDCGISYPGTVKSYTIEGRWFNR